MTEIIITDTITDVLKYVRTKKPVICDIETSSLSVAKGEILTVAFAIYGEDTALVYWPDDGLEQLKKLRLPRGVFHNGKFDIRWLKSYGAKVALFWDTMLMAHLLNENASIGLKSLGQRLLGYPDWSNDEISDLIHRPREETSAYVAQDVIVTRELMEWQRKYIKKNLKPHEDPVFVMRNIMIPAVKPLTMMEQNKVPVRLTRLAQVKDSIDKKLQVIDRKLDQSIPSQDKWPDFLKKATPKWGNTNWTKWWLYTYQGAPIVDVGKPSKVWPEGVPSLSQATLSKIDHPAARLLTERSTLYKLLTGFLVPLQERTHDGRVGTAFSLTGTVTGRLSSSSPSKDDPGINSQQIPRDKRIRTLFGERGQAWIECDYSQLELRVAATIANEPTMLKLFRDGEDIHAYMARKLVGSDDFTHEQRSLAKGVNFGFLYGMMAKHFANYLRESYDVVISPKDAEKFRTEYFENFNKLPEWYRHQRDECIKYGGVHNAFGRFRHLPAVYNEDYWVQENAFRQAVNSPVQSTGSDFMLISLARISRNLRLQQLGAKLITTVHDSVCITAPTGNAEECAKIVKKTMETADDSLEQDFQLRADATISKCWGGPVIAEF